LERPPFMRSLFSCMPRPSLAGAVVRFSAARDVGHQPRVGSEDGSKTGS
jgi:hypothetical protein